MSSQPLIPGVPEAGDAADDDDGSDGSDSSDDSDGSSNNDDDDDDDEEQPDGGCQSRLMAAVSHCASIGLEPETRGIVHDDAWLRAHLGDLFLKAGVKMSVPPGEVIIEQGVPSDRIYLIMEGTAVLRKRQSDGSSRELEGLRGPGDTIGELSFLLGTTPVVSVLATPAIGTTVTKTELCYLDYENAISLVQSQPRVMRRFFWNIAVTLSKRVQRSAVDMKNMLGASLSQKHGISTTHHAAAHLHERSAYEAAEAFGIAGQFETEYEAERALRASCECRVAVETNSASANNALNMHQLQTLGLGLGMQVETNAKLYLFRTHLCIEQSVFSLFTQRQAIALTDILGLVYPTEAADAAEAPEEQAIAATGTAKGAAAATDATDATDVTERNAPLSERSTWSPSEYSHAAQASFKRRNKKVPVADSRDSRASFLSPDEYNAAATTSFRRRQKRRSAERAGKQLKVFDLQLLRGRQGASIRLSERCESLARCVPPDPSATPVVSS